MTEIEELIRAAFILEETTKVQDQFSLRRGLKMKVSSIYQMFKQVDPRTAFELSKETCTPIPSIIGFFNDSTDSVHRTNASVITNTLEEALAYLRRVCSKEELALVYGRLYKNKPWSKLDERFGAQANKRHYNYVMEREYKRGRLKAILKPLLLNN